MHPLVSIVIPVYNVEAYLRECLDSVISQTYKELEIILVDDGSTDSSGRICDEYAADDRRIRVIHQANQSLGAARNVGVTYATGEFTVFIDSDDAVSSDYVELLLAAVGEDDVDVAFTLFSTDHVNGKCGSAEISIVDSRTAIELTLLQRSDFVNSAWKLFRTKLLRAEPFRPRIYYEDLEFIGRIYARARRVAQVRAKAYYYRVTPGSITNKFSARRFDVLSITEELVERYAADPELYRAALVRRFAANFNIFILASLAGGYAQQAGACWRTVKSLRGKVLTYRKARSKDRVGALLSYFGRKATLAVARLFYN